MKVMIIDDSTLIHKVVSEMLEKEGHVQVGAMNGAEARELLKNGEEVDLILLDWNMPIMNGLEFLDVVQKEKFTNAAIVMMTTENKVEKISQALSLGAKEYITKPFDNEILKSKMKIVGNSK
jgi:two-component system, chemotaxis family, chemotaxis protein CheY